LTTSTFQRRTIGIREMLRDTLALVQDREQIRKAMRNSALSGAFRERLMLAVTAVNQCRYCSYAHSRMALTAGLSEQEISELCGGVYDSCPPEELPAVLYAEHWAENDGKPDAAARSSVIELYGEPLVEQMEIVLRMIRMGNMMGNAWDHFLYRVSFGRWGGCCSEETPAE